MRLSLVAVEAPGLNRALTMVVEPRTVAAVIAPSRETAVRLADVIVRQKASKGAVDLVADTDDDAGRAGGDIRLVPADGGLLPHLSIRDNIGYGRRFGDGAPARMVELAVGDMARKLQLDDVLGERPADVTPEQRQRAGLARALLGDPGAVVVEDLIGSPEWQAQRTHLERVRDCPILVITDDLARIPGSWPHCSGL